MLVGSGFVGSLAAAPPAQARYATQGTGTYRGAIDWFEWGTANQPIPLTGTTRTNTRTVAGQTLATTCTIGATSGGQGLIAYRPGEWHQDGLDDMYNIGGTGGNNQLIAGLANRQAGSTVSFSFACSATLGGVPVPLAGLVMADAEASGTAEYVQATIPAAGEWRLIDRYRSPGCTQTATLTRTGQTLRLSGAAVSCPTFPTGVAFMEGVTSADVVVRGGGKSAIALGVMLASDFGDAPASYGEAGSLYSTTFAGGLVPQGASSAFALDLATPGQPVPRLGALVDSEGAYQPSAGADADGADEDAITAPGTVLVRPGATYTLPDVVCTGPGTVAGWLDWDGDGAFGADERSTAAPCASGRAALTWTVPADTVAGRTFLRLRIGVSEDAVAQPVGMTTAGEVEDHPLTLELPRPTITKSSSATADSRVGDTVTYTVTARNDTGLDFTSDYPAVVQDTLAGVLDDGTYAGDASADRDGALSYAAPTLRWAGPLAVGDAVTLTYTVTLRAGGDGQVRNVAWGGGGAGSADVPVCDPPSGGLDPATGVPCAETENLLPRLSVRKSASTTELPADGGTVRYTVQVSNPGPGAYTASAPATVTDDLGDVLDDAVYTGDAQASLGAVDVDGDLLTWSGPLGVGDTATLTYTVTYDADAGGDHVLRNAACVGTEDVLPGDPACSRVSVPGAALQQWKTADPASGTSVVPGQEIAYRLVLRNNGQATATVDTVDDLSDVVDDGELGAVSADPGVAATLDGTALRLTGSIPAGETRTVTYIVRVAPWSQQANHVLGNVLGADCPADGAPGAAECRTVHPVVGRDLGDAPAGYGTAGDGAPSHLVPGYDPATGTAPLVLGTVVDLEDDGVPSAGADGDDLATGDGVGDDEDALDGPLVVTTGAPTAVTVTATNDTDAPATLVGWLDLDGDGAFSPAERVAVLVPARSGTAAHALTFPAGTVAQDTTLRLRLFPGDLTAGDPSPVGPADAGEVEDHPVTVLTPAIELTKTSDATADVRPGDTVTYRVTATNTGTGDYTEENPAVVVDDLAGVLDDATFTGRATADRGDDPTYAAPRLRWAGALPAGESVTVEYGVTLAPGGDGTVRNVAWAPGAGDPGPAPDCATADVPCADHDVLLPRLTLRKTADRNDLPAVGERLTYEVTVHNAGPGTFTAAAPATFADDLTEVLDDARLDTASVSATTGDTAFDDPSLTWSGALEPGRSAVVRYSVTYTGEGDLRLANAACVPADDAVDPDDACRTVTTPGSGLRQTKTVDPRSGTSVEAGQRLTYTLTFENVGPAPATVDTTDDLSGVLDDAVLVDGPTADDGLVATPVGDGLAITGTVPVDAVLTVSYTVEVRATGAQGDRVLRNALACQPGDGPECEPSVTQNPVRHLGVTKTSDATAESRPGDVVTYTVTATNPGPGAYTADSPAVVLDDLAGVLDDATYGGDAEADRPGQVTTAGSLLSWAGALGSGETVTLTYTVTLGGVAGGDGVVRNVAFVPDCAPGEQGCAPVPPECADGQDPATGLACASTETLLPRLTVAKTANRAEVTATGQEVTFRVVVQNTGPGTYTESAPALVSDDLRDVLDDATLVEGSVVADRGEPRTTGGALSWTGALGPQESATITYTVRYTAAGDRALTNTACVPTAEALDPEADCATVTVPGSGLVQGKSVDPDDGSPVRAGQEVAYTLTFENRGDAPATVGTTDDLSGVLDDAELMGDPVAEDGLAATVDGTTLTVTGTVPAGQTRTVTYTVTVRAFTEQGDHVLRNVLACPPGDGAGCEASVTQNPVRHLAVTKTSDAATGTGTGSLVEYTVTVTNDGAADFTADDPARVTDDLSGVLDDALLEGEVTATSGDVTSAEPVLTWTGGLEAGASASFSYTVRVTNRGDHRLVNTASVPGELCAGPDAPCTATVVTPLPHVVPAKTADPAPGTALAAGQVVTYTLTFTNEGLAPGPVGATDDLSGVLDDAAVTAEPVVGDGGAVTATRDGDRLRVEGSLDAGDTATVTYQVTVGADGERGDDRLRNLLAPDVPVVTCPEDGVCQPAPALSTDHPVGELADRKTVDPASGATVRPGTELTYTLHFANTGEADVAVAREDALAGVLDDADLVGVPVSSDDALAVSPVVDGRFAVTGVLAPGQEETVTYTVVVRGDGERGDDRLANALVDPGAEPSDECLAGTGETPEAAADCTVNHVSDVTVLKSADPQDGTAVRDGDEITYTLTFRNVSADESAAPAAVDYTDHLSGVLDDARLVAGPTPSSGSLGATLTADRIRVVGELATGDTTTVTYTVRVAAYGEQGDHELVNAVARTGETPACGEGSPLCTTHPTVEPVTADGPAGRGEAPPARSGDGLASTGAGVLGLLAAALALLGLGALGVRTSRTGRRQG